MTTGRVAIKMTSWSGYAFSRGSTEMTKRVDRLMEIGVLGYVVVAVTQVLMAGSAASSAPEWVAGLAQLMGGR